MIKFIEQLHEVFQYEYHKPRFASDYVLENGVYVFEAKNNDDNIEVTLETALSLLMNDYNCPDPDYEVKSITTNGEQVELDDIEASNPELYEAINDLRSLCVYDQSCESYRFKCVGRKEHNYAEKIQCEYEELDIDNYEVTSCIPIEK